MTETKVRFDWGMAVLSVWVVVGFYLDLWAHEHGLVDDTFLTPWHAVLYAGATAFGLTLGVFATRNLVRGVPWRAALPGPYLASLLGVIGFLIAGQLDFTWHSIFGFEVSVAALLSPPHLALAACGIVAFSAPVRSVWARPRTAASWRRHGPALVGLTAMLAVFAAFTQYAHPIVDPVAGVGAGPATRAPVSQLYAMAADGTGQRRIAVSDIDERGPRLSSDGRRLAFDAFIDGAAQIVVSDPDGSNRQVITTEGNSARPAWSPDGTRIAFHSDRAGSLDIWTMAADGTDPRQVTTEPSEEYGATWSPDGTRLAFTSDRDGRSDIHSARADGSDVVRLTTGGGADPAWSPDGSRIAFGSPAADGGVEVVSMATDGSDARRLTDADGDSYLPAWSPDGRSIAFATDRDGDLEVYVMNADGTDQRNLTRSAAIRDGWFGPSWSPDGSTILYPSQSEIPAAANDDLRDALGAASILIQTALLAGFALVALRRGPVPFGGLTLLVFAPTALMALVSDEYRFLPGALLAGLFADLLVRRLGYGSSRRTDVVIAFAIPASFCLAYFATLQLTGGIVWTIHLWLGAIVLAGVIGLLIDEAMRGGRPVEASTPTQPT
jgi:TolB protein